jgi:hypothetical protein
MSRLAAGGPASLTDRRSAEITNRLLRDELTRVRAAGLAWRNGLAGLLVGLLGFSLIRGRSDVTQLAAPWNVVVGAVLLAAFLAGAAGALRLLWAAHGRPTAMERRMSRTRQAADHAEAVAGVAALRSGIVLSLACAALLVTAVGITWYGPGRSQPALQVTTPTGTVCGTIVGTDAGVVTLNTDSGETKVDLRSATGIRTVAQSQVG